MNSKKTTIVFDIVTTNYVRVSSKAIYLRMIITQILITSIN